jgi:hypothetical protein
LHSAPGRASSSRPSSVTITPDLTAQHTSNCCLRQIAGLVVKLVFTCAQSPFNLPPVPSEGADFPRPVLAVRNRDQLKPDLAGRMFLQAQALLVGIISAV